MAFVTCGKFKTSQEKQDEKISTLEQELQQCCEENSEKNSLQDEEINNIKKRLDALKSKNDGLEAENGRLSVDLETCRSSKKALEDAKTTAENKVAILQNDKVTLEEKVKKLEEDLSKCKANSGGGNSTGGQDINSQIPPTSDQIPSGINQPVQALSCGGAYEYSGSNTRQSYYYSVDKSQGDLILEFTPYEIPDAIRVWQDKKLVFESYPFGITYDPTTKDTADGVVLANDSYLTYIKNGQSHKVSPIPNGTPDTTVIAKVNAETRNYLRVFENTYLHLPKQGDRVSEDPSVTLNVPVEKETKYIFVEVIPNPSDKTTWKLISYCPAERVGD